MKYLVSVVIPLFNGEKTIRKAVDSVIEQTLFDKTELILIDDGSEDKSFQIAEKLAKKYPKNIFALKNPHNLGIAKTQNIGLKRATGKYVARLDQDDLWIDNEKLKKQAAALEKDPSLGLVGTWTKVANANGPDFMMIPPTEDQKIREKMLMACMFVAPSVMFRKALSEKIGFYREDLKYGTEDYEYWLRIGTVAKFKNIPEYCLEYHFHPASYSNQNKIMAIREHVSIIKNYKTAYPHFTRSYLKNSIQYNLLKIKFLRKIYNYIVPRIAGKIYS